MLRLVVLSQRIEKINFEFGFMDPGSAKDPDFFMEYPKGIPAPERQVSTDFGYFYRSVQNLP